ncbi:MAG: amino acid ABC transporter permease [Hyphomicrobiales bacterium]|nr:amino acid ABC transporter permease [Hyphomicrobiales bacterium]
MRIVRRRRPGRWVAVAVAALLAVGFVDVLLTRPQWEWSTVWRYLFAPVVLRGLANTIQLTFIAMFFGLVFGLVVALMRLSGSPVLRAMSGIYIWFNRAVPVLVTLLFIFFLAALVPTISFGVPYGPQFVSYPTNQLISQFTAAALGLIFIEAAYIAEIIRGGILSVPRGQAEAARSVGMTEPQLFRRVVLPQAIRVMVPALGNQFISLFKNTSIVSVIGYSELLATVQAIYTQTYQTIPLLTVACIWYLSLASLAMVGQGWLERRFGRGFEASPTISGAALRRMPEPVP